MREQDLFLEKALLGEQVITAEQIDQARRYSSEHETDLVDAIIALEYVTGRDLALIRADISETVFVNLADYELCYTNTQYLPRAIAERTCSFPLFVVDNVMTLAMDDPMDLDAADQVRQVTRCEVDAVLADREQIRAMISRAYSLSHGQEIGVDEVELVSADEHSNQPIIAAVQQLLKDAVEQHASDIHLSPDEHELHLRYRIDGVLQPRQGPSLSMHAALVQRLKVMAHLDLTQTRRPQDGKFRFRHGNQQVDVRLSTVPTVCGENAVMRLLANTQAVTDFHELGMNAGLAREMETVLQEPYGMLLVTGPTGSGKTTTLYTALSKLNTPARNIMTIEDPVEIRLPLIRQIQVHPEIGLTFANALRSILRQDPDVVLVGEIRDQETATIALQAALTGHMVLSTVHTNDAPGAIARLRDFNLPPFVINSALLAVIAQRLVRRVCQHCVHETVIDELTQRRFDLEVPRGFVEGRGCARCSQSGFRGRVGIYEFFRITAGIKALIEAGESTERIRQCAVDEGMTPMWRDGLEKARLGLTTLGEISAAASLTAMATDPGAEHETTTHDSGQDARFDTRRSA
ncbi:MAG: type II/IV secretion system protein [Phycisphaerales bacterium]|nr:MAG: type II/IV secretion system protein [Phycisphaerales bacterium]